MKIVRTIGLLVAAAGISLAQVAAEAATVTPNGIVLVNSGNGFVRINAATQVQPGDMIMINDGSAQITYNCGSTGQLAPGQVYSVHNDNQACADGHAGAAEGGGLAGGIAGISTTALVVGGLAVAGVVGAAVAASQSSSP